MDRPAVVLTTVIALILIAVSIPFTILWWGEGHAEYEVDWEAAETGSAAARLTAAPQTQRAEVTVDNVLTAFVNVTVAPGQCSDGGQPPLSQPATMRWTLSVSQGGQTTQMDSGTFTCSQAPVEKSYARTARPDLGNRTVDNMEDSTEERAAARAAVWDPDLLGSLNETATYILEISSTRPAGTLPLPPPALSVTMELKVYRWEALLREVTDDVAVR